MNLILQLFKYFGAFAAIVLGIGFVAKTDLSLLATQTSQVINDAELPPTQEYAAISLSKAQEDLRSDGYRKPPSSFSGNVELPSLREAPASRTVRTVATRESTPVRNTSGNTRRSADFNSWVEINLAQTFLESEKETMSPGVILATGLYFLQQGQGDLSMTAGDVAEYLAELRDHASAEAKSHMKYIANSEEWFTGLKLAGFDGAQIASLYHELGLAVYDKTMYARHVEKRIEQPDYSGSSEDLAADVEARKRNLADAYNQYADQPEVRKKYGLPSAKAPAPITTAEVSEGRQEANSFRKGESRAYDNPRLFWAVLQEMIALENEYDSWDAYREDYPQEADKEFQQRSDIMALGGEMKVTRKRR